MGSRFPDLSEELEGRLAALGFELVELTWAGSPRRPILRIRMDLPDSVPGKGGVTVEQCAQVSRALEPWLDSLPGLPERYVLEVSSPGVDRPLTKPRDWSRFQGQVARVTGDGLGEGLGRRVEGEILSLRTTEEGRLEVELRLGSGERRWISLDRVERAHLVYKWE